MKTPRKMIEDTIKDIMKKEIENQNRNSNNKVKGITLERYG